MKVLKWLLVLLGVAGIIAAAVYSYLSWFNLQKLVAVAESMRSAPQVNPQQQMALAIGLALLGAFLFGIGLGMPRRSAGQIRRQALESAAATREAEIRGRATATDLPPATDPNRTDPNLTDPNGVDPNRRDRHGRDR